MNVHRQTGGREEGGVKVKTEEEVSRLVVYRQLCLHPKMQLQETKLSLPPPEILLVGLSLSTAVQQWWQQGHTGCSLTALTLLGH